jgi:hypothetical protein
MSRGDIFRTSYFFAMSASDMDWDRLTVVELAAAVPDVLPEPGNILPGWAVLAAEVAAMAVVRAMDDAIELG